MDTTPSGALGRLPEEFAAYLEEAAGALRMHHGPNLLSAVLYGSAARGRLPGARDIDLMLVLRRDPHSISERGWKAYQTTRSLEQSARARALRAEGLPTAFSYKVYDLDQLATHPPLLLDMTEDAILLYDPEAVVETHLEAIRRRMREYGSRRVWLPDGSWYWILKPDIKIGETIQL